MYGWFLVSVWLHLLAAIVWIGGLAFISMVLAPTLRDPALRTQAVPLLLVIMTLALPLVRGLPI